MFCKKGVFKKLARFTGKHMCWNLFLINLQGSRRSTLLRRDSKTDISLVKFAKFLTKPFWRTHGNDCLWKNRRTFCVGKCLSCYIVAENFVTPGTFYNFNLTFKEQPSSDSKFLSPLICSNAECLEILIILHICLFLTSYDSSKSRLCEMETIVASHQSGELYCNLSLRKFDFQWNYSSHNLYIGFHSQSVRIRWWLMKHSQGFLMLEVTQPLLCFWVNLVFVSSPTIIHKLSEASSDCRVA